MYARKTIANLVALLTRKQSTDIDIDIGYCSPRELFKNKIIFFLLFLIGRSNQHFNYSIETIVK